MLALDLKFTVLKKENEQRTSQKKKQKKEKPS